MQAVSRGDGFATLPVTHVDRIHTAVTQIAHSHRVAAMTTKQQSLQQSQSLACRPVEQRSLRVRPIAREALLVLQELLPAYKAFMVLWKMDPPLRHLHGAHMLVDTSFGADLSLILISSKHVAASVAGVLEHAQHAGVREPPPEQLPIPCTAVSSLWNAKFALLKTVHDTIRTAGLTKQLKNQCNRASHFLIGVHHDTSLIIVTKADRQRKTQFALLCFVEFTALEPGAQKVKFRACHRSLQAQQEPIVEVRRVIATIIV